MRRLLITALLCWLPAVALAQSLGAPLVGARNVVNNCPGNQSDPHVSEALVAYTNESQGLSEIRYHHLSTGQDQAIPNGGAYDFVADVSGDTVVFTRVGQASSIFAFNVRTQAPAVEVAPQQGSNRRAAVIGHHTVAWQDFSYGTEAPEITAFNLDTQELTRLSTDESLDRAPAVSADGSTVVWSKCSDGTACDIWQAVAGQGGFQVQALTGAQGEEAQPDTNGQVVVYSSARVENGVLERDIYWQAAGGGQEFRLPLPGVDANPSISGSLLAFERQDPSSSSANFDIVLFDLQTQTLYRLTETPQSESLNDVSVGSDGLVRVVWSVPENGEDVFAFTFRLPGNPGCDPQLQAQTQAADVCSEPGNRPMLASMTLDRATGRPQEASREFEATGQGVLCVDNGYQGLPATAGWVVLNGVSVADPSHFQKAGGLLAQEVTLSGASTLAARIASAPGSGFRVRLYGPAPACAAGFLGNEVIPGKRVEPEAWRAPAEPLEATPLPLAPEASALRCGMSGESLAWVGALLVAALLWRARPVPVPARRRSGTGRAR
jgi:hypothetical protein